MFKIKLNRQKFIDSVDSDKIWSKSLNIDEILNLLNQLEKEISKHSFKIDNNFIMNERRKNLKSMIFDRLDSSNDKLEEDIKESLFNFWEFINDEYDGSLINISKELNLPLEKVINRCEKYKKNNIICLQEKNIILEMINKLKLTINDDKN